MMSSIEPIKYKYNMNVKLNQVPGRTLVASVFPHAEDLMISSKNFEDFESAVASVGKLTEEIVLSLNTAIDHERYGVLSEVNPARSGQETLSKEWGAHEIAKVWVIDKIRQAESPGPIKAIGLAQVVETHEEMVRVQ